MTIFCVDSIMFNFYMDYESYIGQYLYYNYPNQTDCQNEYKTNYSGDTVMMINDICLSGMSCIIKLTIQSRKS